MPVKRYVGLMSGTSIDGIDCALIRCGAGIELEATLGFPIPEGTRDAIATISHSGPDEIERLGRLDRELGELFAQACLALLRQAAIEPDEVRAIGSHGQTIRHRPPSAGELPERAFTLQIADPNTIAEITGIATVADFRRRDMAAGGEGAPLAPAFHAAAFARADVTRAIVNIGGIANVSILRGEVLHSGFDTGPGNTLLDQWIAGHRGQAYDEQGQWAAQGCTSQPLLDRLLQHPFFSLQGPRSTGKEDFNLPWLLQSMAALAEPAAADVQSTLADLTAESIARGIRSSGVRVDETYVCGGGAHNKELLRRLQARLPASTVDTTARLGIDPDWVEAATFGWLAHRTLEGLAGNAPAVTGARAPRILGGIYPA
jgi:anhydro-N-acetylmuramic acid kinase